MLSQAYIRPGPPELEAVLLRALPTQGAWKDDDYLWLTNHTSDLIELTDGFLEVLPMPTDRHQTLLMFLYDMLREWSRQTEAKVLPAPLRLQIRPGKFREPDLLLLLDKNDARRGNSFWTGADLVVEIVSPEGQSRDLVDKPLDYAQAGIPRYLVVDPDTETVTAFELSANAYREVGRYGRGSNLTVLDGLVLQVDTLFDAD